MRVVDASYTSSFTIVDEKIQFVDHDKLKLVVEMIRDSLHRDATKSSITNTRYVSGGYQIFEYEVYGDPERFKSEACLEITINIPNQEMTLYTKSLTFLYKAFKVIYKIITQCQLCSHGLGCGIKVVMKFETEEGRKIDIHSILAKYSNVFNMLTGYITASHISTPVTTLHNILNEIEICLSSILVKYDVLGKHNAQGERLVVTQKDLLLKISDVYGDIYVFIEKFPLHDKIEYLEWKSNRAKYNLDFEKLIKMEYDPAPSSKWTKLLPFHPGAMGIISPYTRFETFNIENHAKREKITGYSHISQNYEQGPLPSEILIHIIHMTVTTCGDIYHRETYHELLAALYQTCVMFHNIIIGYFTERFSSWVDPSKWRSICYGYTPNRNLERRPTHDYVYFGTLGPYYDPESGVYVDDERGYCHKIEDKILDKTILDPPEGVLICSAPRYKRALINNFVIMLTSAGDAMRVNGGHRVNALRMLQPHGVNGVSLNRAVISSLLSIIWTFTFQGTLIQLTSIYTKKFKCYTVISDYDEWDDKRNIVIFTEMLGIFRDRSFMQSNNKDVRNTDIGSTLVPIGSKFNQNDFNRWRSYSTTEILPPSLTPFMNSPWITHINKSGVPLIHALCIGIFDSYKEFLCKKRAPRDIIEVDAM